MPTQGGPSRRSHTKSRKGCKTCKRRHIRCDETFPQCRNCTKHQVRCDYMDSFGSDAENANQNSPEQTPSVVLTPGSESRVDAWQQTGTFPYPELNVFPQPSTQEYSRDDLRLMHHLSRLSTELQLEGTSAMTVWTQRFSKMLSIACSYPYVMHALLSFAANHLAWTRNSNDARNLHIHYGAIALGGLHEAISSFSSANADAVLASSLLLLWQATDWRSWSSLRAGIQSVLTAMQSGGHQSIFADLIAEEDLVATAYRTHRRTASVSPSERANILQNVILALQTLQLSLSGQDLEAHWVEQVLTYMQTLTTLDPPRSPEEQFNQLYYLRKWIFWVPVQLLHGRGPSTATVLTIAHLYAIALAVDPLFPDLGSSFCAAMSLPPLEAALHLANTNSTDLIALLQWPQQVALSFRARAMVPQPQVVPRESAYNLTLDTLNYASVGNLSPAFAPAGLHYTGTPQTATSTSSQSSYLEVPSFTSGFAYGTETWGAVPSPGLPATEYVGSNVGDDIEIYGYSPLSTYSRGHGHSNSHGHSHSQSHGHGAISSDGFVSPALVWA